MFSLPKRVIWNIERDEKQALLFLLDPVKRRMPRVCRLRPRKRIILSCHAKLKTAGRRDFGGHLLGCHAHPRATLRLDEHNATCVPPRIEEASLSPNRPSPCRNLSRTPRGSTSSPVCKSPSRQSHFHVANQHEILSAANKGHHFYAAVSHSAG